MSLECCHCKHTFASKHTLTTHQKKAMYCLEIQHRGALTKAEIKDEDAQFECSSCKVKFMTKFALAGHMKICKVQDSTSLIISLNIKLAECSTTIEMLRDQNQKLEDMLTKKEQNQQHVTLAAISKPTSSVKTTVKNCVIQNLSPLIEEEMREHEHHLTIEHVKAGAEGYAKYALEFPLKDKFTCTDVSRKKLAWKDIDGNIIYDNEGSKLAEKFFRVLKQRNSRVFRDIIIDLGERCDAAYKRNDQDEADAIVELTEKICDWRKQAMDTSNGQDTELRNDFIKYLCLASKV